MLDEATASTLKEAMAAEGLSQEEVAGRLAADREKKMQEIINALAVLAQSSGGWGGGVTSFMLIFRVV